MDLEQIKTAVKEIGSPFRDSRTNVFEVEPAALNGNNLILRGRVLDESNRRALVEGLAERFPELKVDVREVEVGRKKLPEMLWVATNLTSVHDDTSFLAEQVTQMLNGMAVEVLWRKERWCFARQEDGYLGWTYAPYLTDVPAPRPTHQVVAPVSLLRADPAADAALVTRVLGGTALCVVGSTSVPGWTRAEMAGGWKGWLPQEDIRAFTAFPDEAGPRREQLVADAYRMIGVPYLWGGCSANGIDCSGFAQLLHRWIGITIPRDADMQYDAGKPVEPPFEAGDLLFFGEAGENRRITHVGISLGGWNMIHSSRSRNGVQVDDVQLVDHLRDSYLCAAAYIGK